MPVMDEFKDVRAEMKNASFKSKLRYFWDYYKWYPIIAIIVIIVIVYQINFMMHRRDVVFHACLLNAAEEYIPVDADVHTQPFAEYASIDLKTQEILYDNSMRIGSEASNDDYTSAQKLMILISAKEIDVMASDVYTMLRYAYQGDFFDLRTILSADQIEKYSENFYYIDEAVKNSMQEESYSLVKDALPDYPNPFKPEEMETPIPVGVRFPEGSTFLKEFKFSGQGTLSVMINTEHQDLALQFLEYCMQVEETAEQ